jgi:Tfp pilus assembly protein PilN
VRVNILYEQVFLPSIVDFLELWERPGFLLFMLVLASVSLLALVAMLTRMSERVECLQERILELEEQLKQVTQEEQAGDEQVALRPSPRAGNGGTP